jgi:hypothetical protein
MLDHLFISYGSITAVDIEQNFENMRKAWNPQHPVETLFKLVQDCVNFAESGGVTTGATQNSHLCTPISSSLEFLAVLAVDGMKNWQQTRPRTASRFMLRLHIANTDKYKEKLWEPNDMQMLPPAADGMT